MKKGRPGQLLRVIARPAERDHLARRILAESSAIGVRMSEMPRLKLERESARSRRSAKKRRPRNMPSPSPSADMAGDDALTREQATVTPAIVLRGSVVNADPGSERRSGQVNIYGVSPAF